jgi:signal peptidase II
VRGLPPQGGTRLKYTWFWLAAIFSVTADLISKQVVFSWVEDATGGRMELIPGQLWFTTHYNTGMLWGMGQGYRLPILALTSLIIPALIAIAYSCKVPRAPLWALGVLLGGALGNLYDRMLFEGVRDFVDLGWWPVFNIADVEIVIGVFVYAGWNILSAPAAEKVCGEPACAAGERDE